MSDQLVAEAAAYTTHNKHKRRTFIPSVGFEPAIPAVGQLQTYACGRMTTEICFFFFGHVRRSVLQTIRNILILQKVTFVVTVCRDVDSDDGDDSSSSGCGGGGSSNSRNIISSMCVGGSSSNSSICSSSVLFNFALEYAIRRVQVNQDGLKLNGTHQLLAYADDVNILGGSIHSLKENAEALVAATREIGLEVNADKTKYMVMSRDQNAG